MLRIKLLLLLGLLVTLLIVVFQNTEPVETRILFLTVTMPRAALLAIMMLLGMVTGILLSLVMWGKSRIK